MITTIEKTNDMSMPVLYRNLEQILNKKGIEYTKVAKRLSITKECFYKKLTGQRPFYLKETLKIRELLNFEYTLDYLFRE
jgi:predicted transcriptional regulator